MGGHGFDRIEEDGERYVLVCECGWRSGPHASGGAVGAVWDEHRAAEAAER